jgi:pimeloyl-ACP methyl ester carboxylesterase
MAAQLARRGFLAVGGLSALALASCTDDRATVAQTPFVLVHGAMHGGWCWKRVRRELSMAGADVFTPTLTGLGERAHLNSEAVGLSTHVQDIVNCILCEEMTNVVLVGHSYAGMVITGVADSLGDRIGRLVYLDGLVPHNGESTMQAMGLENLTLAETRAVKPYPNVDYGVKNAEDLAWVRRHLSPQGVRTFNEPLSLTRDLSAIKRCYIACTAARNDGSEIDRMRKFAMARIDHRWRREEIATGHDAMVTAPKSVARLLLTIARG